MRTRTVLVLVVGALGLSTLLPAPVASARPGRGVSAALGPGCLAESGEPTLITADVVLRRDLRCQDLLWVVAPGVTVDLGRHRVVVDGTRSCLPFGDGCNIDVGGGRLTNGSVTGASLRVGGGAVVGVHARDGDVVLTQPVEGASGTSAVEASIVENGLVLFEGVGARLERSWVVRGGGVVLHNSERGIDGFVIRANVIAGNRGTGISNVGHVHFEDDVSGTVEGNLLLANARDGVAFVGVTTSLGAVDIRHNVALGNGGSGIVVAHDPSPVPHRGGPVTITGNLSVLNGGHGIDATGGADGSVDVVDGGGNAALANGAEPACVGVVCS